jgi:hypothetical protein
MTESLPILLHAAARGARLQLDYGYPEPYRWKNVAIMPSRDSKIDQWRIHPADQHMRYGPISSVLAEMAEKPPAWFAEFRTRRIWEEVASDLAYRGFDCDQFAWHNNTSTLDRSLFLLLVAESLIEDGL